VEGNENYIMKSFKICTIYKIFAVIVYKMKEDDRGRIFTMH
jgi:hypothetical protein